jgi:hypothetical protein
MWERLCLLCYRALPLDRHGVPPDDLMGYDQWDWRKSIWECRCGFSYWLPAVSQVTWDIWTAATRRDGYRVTRYHTGISVEVVEE